MSANFMVDFDYSKMDGYVFGGATLPAPDQYVGMLDVTDGKLTFEFRERDTIDYNENGYTYKSGFNYLEYNILVVLESPHRYEYDKNGNPRGLAMGKTGQNLFELFTHALSQSKMKLRDGSYNVVLSNAVQYQTSCGLNPLDRDLRDRNWKNIYQNNGGEQDFKERVFRIKPRYTINLCTGGRNPEGLRSLVTKSLINFGLKKDKHFAEGNHPASWNFNGDIKNARIY